MDSTNENGTWMKSLEQKTLSLRPIWLFEVSHGVSLGVREPPRKGIHSRQKPSNFRHCEDIEYIQYISHHQTFLWRCIEWWFDCIQCIFCSDLFWICSWGCTGKPLSYWWFFSIRRNWWGKGWQIRSHQKSFELGSWIQSCWNAKALHLCGPLPV